MQKRPRILVTRSSEQASALADHIRALGADAILIPTIELTEPSTFAPLDAAIEALAGSKQQFDWLLFTSANAVEAFGKRSEALSRPLAHGVRNAVIGAATARAVQALGWTVDLVPPRAVAESLARALLPFALQPDGSATRFLLVRAEEAREHLPETLRAAGAEVTVVAAYRNVLAGGSIEPMRDLFRWRESAPDAITFTSASTVRNFFALMDAAGATLPEDVVLASIGPITSAALREHGYEPGFEASEATVLCLAEGVVAHLSERSPQGLKPDLLAE